MTFARGCAAVLSVLLVGSATWAGQAGQERDLFADLEFQQGFPLSYPDSSQGWSVEAVLHLGDANNVPVWRLCQWATRYSLATVPCTQPTADDPSHYAVANMNLGWEIPGTFDAAIQIRDLRMSAVTGGYYEIHPALADSEEEFERLANTLRPGDELVLHGGEYSQNGRRAVTANGTAEAPIVIRAAQGQSPLLTRPADQIDRYNNIEFVDCSHLVIRGLRFRGGSSGVRFIRGHHITFEDCEIFETGNNALTMNSGDCDSFIIRRNHLHHTGLSTTRSTEGEGMYIGCHDGSCITTNTLVEGNYIHHLRSTSDGGNDGIEIKVGSFGNIVRDNVIHDTNIGRRYPGIFVYGGGPQVNIVEGNAIWNAGEGIQVVSDAIVRNNIILHCSATGITAAPHVAVRQMRNVTIVNNTIVNHPRGVLVRWTEASDMLFSNNAVYCPGGTAIDASGMESAVVRVNYVEGRLAGVALDGMRFLDGGAISQVFTGPEQNQFWPKPGSRLIGHADSTIAPELDFNHAAREAPHDVGAYESDGQISNPGWNVQAGFKRVQ